MHRKIQINMVDSSNPDAIREEYAKNKSIKSTSHGLIPALIVTLQISTPSHCVVLHTNVDPSSISLSSPSILNITISAR